MNGPSHVLTAYKWTDVLLFVFYHAHSGPRSVQWMAIIVFKLYITVTTIAQQDIEMASESYGHKHEVGSVDQVPSWIW